MIFNKITFSFIAFFLISSGFSQLSWKDCAELKPTDFEKITIAVNSEDKNFQEPVRLDLDKAGNVYVALLESGQIVKYELKDGAYLKRILGIIPVHTATGFHGLIGMALSPDFEKTGWVYTITSHLEGVIILFRLSRFTIKNNFFTMASRKIILEWPTQATEGHTGGEIKFSTDGNMYITTGNDAFNVNNSQPHPITNEEDEQRNALRSSANTNDLRGKVLRIKPIALSETHPENEMGIGKTYTIPEGNLFPVGMAKTRPEIFIMGLRNPYTMQLDKNGTVYIADVGPGGKEDLIENGKLICPSGGDQLYISATPANFGFPMFIHGDKDQGCAIYDYKTKKVNGYYDSLKPWNHSKFNTGLDTLPPVLKKAAGIQYHDPNKLTDITKFWFKSGRMSLMAGPIYEYDPASTSPDKFPPHFDGKFIYAEYLQNWVKVATVEGETITQVDSIFNDMKFESPLTMTFGPDGALYFNEYGHNWRQTIPATKLSKVIYKGDCRPTLAEGIAGKNGSSPFPGLSMMYLERNGLIPVPKGASQIEIYNLKGVSVWKAKTENRSSIPVPEFLKKGIWLVHIAE